MLKATLKNVEHEKKKVEHEWNGLSMSLQRCLDGYLIHSPSVADHVSQNTCSVTIYPIHSSHRVTLTQILSSRGEINVPSPWIWVGWWWQKRCYWTSDNKSQKVMPLPPGSFQDAVMLWGNSSYPLGKTTWRDHIYMLCLISQLSSQLTESKHQACGWQDLQVTPAFESAPSLGSSKLRP